MKIHLPSRLRKALLACLAALAIPASLPGTLGTASGVAAVWLASSQSAQADVDPRPAPLDSEGKPLFDEWQRVEVKDGLIRQWDSQWDNTKNEKKGVYKFNSGTLNVTGKHEVAGLDVEAGVLNIETGATLTVEDLYNGKSTISGGGTLEFRDAPDAGGGYSVASDGLLSVENLVFLGTGEATGTGAALGGKVTSSTIDVRRKDDWLVVRNFTNTEKLTKRGLGTLSVNVGGVLSPNMELTLEGGVLNIQGGVVSLSLSNLTWGEGTHLGLNGTSESRIIGDVVLDKGRTLHMGSNAHISSLTLASDDAISWSDELWVSTLRTNGGDVSLRLTGDNTLHLAGFDKTAFAGDILPSKNLLSQGVDGHGGNLRVTGWYTLSGEVDVHSTTVDFGQLTLEGTDKNKYLGDLSVVGSMTAEVVVHGTVTASLNAYSSGTISGDGTLRLTGGSYNPETGGGFNGTLSVKNLVLVGEYAFAWLGGEVSSPVIDVEEESAWLTVNSFTGAELTKRGAGTLSIGDAPLPDKLTLEKGTLDIMGEDVSFSYDSLSWNKGTTLRLSGSESNKLVSDKSIVLKEGYTLRMGTKASIADLTVAGADIWWQDNLTVDTLRADKAGTTLSLTLGETLILGSDDKDASDYAGDIDSDSDYRGDLTVAFGKHTFSGKVKADEMVVKSGAELVDNGAFTVNRLTGSGTISGAGKLTLTGVDQLNSGKLSRSDYAGKLDINDLVVEQGSHILGVVKPEVYTTVGNLTLGMNDPNATQAQLHVAGTLALEKSLTLYLGEDRHKVEHPYLRADWLELPSDGAKVKLTLHNKDILSNLGTPSSGNIDNYYLLDGLKQGVTIGAFDTSEFDSGVKDILRRLNVDTVKSPKGYNDYELKLVVRGDSLALVFYQNEPYSWVWKGVDAEKSTNIWKGNSHDGWNRHYTDNTPEGTPDGEHVYFKGVENGDEVKVSGAVEPSWVTVTDGKYRFTDAGSGRIDLDVGDGKTRKQGEFDVQGGGVVDMQVATDIPVLNLGTDKGQFTSKFIVHHKDAIQDDTRINLYGENAVLAFGETNGEIDAKGLNSEALAKNIRLQGTALNIQVGETYREYVKENGLLTEGATYAVPTEELTIGGDFGAFVDHDVTSGSLLRSNVVEDALTRGLTINKTGRLGLVLEWKNDTRSVAAYRGGVNVKEGSLTLKAHWKDVNLAGEVVVSKGGTLKLQGDAEQTVEISSGLKSSGWVDRGDAEMVTNLLTNPEARVVLGSNEDKVIYRLSGNNSGFGGTIELVGDGVTDVAVFENRRTYDQYGNVIGRVDATGGKGTTLELKGRALTFDTERTRDDLHFPSVVTAGTVNVVEGTVNMVGGYDMTEYATDPNVRITFQDGKITGNGTLANAELDFHHTINDDLRDFHGAIVAGYLQGRDRTPDDKVNPGEGVSPNRSSWTLHVASDVTELDVTLAGTGLIEVGKVGSQDPNATPDLTLKGAVGDAKWGDTVALKNIDTGDIILTNKNVTTGKLLTGVATDENGQKLYKGGFVLDGEGAEWKGGALGDGVTFTLKEGALTGVGGITEKGKDAKLVVNAQGVVDLNGTNASRLDEVTVNGHASTGNKGTERHGQLKGIGGDVLDTAKTGVTLVFDQYNFDNQAAMLSFATEGGGTLKVTQSDTTVGPDGIPNTGLVLDFTTEGLVDILRQHCMDNEKGGKGNVTDLHIVDNGKLDLSSVTDPGNMLQLLTQGPEPTRSGYGKLLAWLGLTLNADKADQGILSLSGTSKDVYLVLGGEKGEYGSRSHNVTVGDINSEVMESSKAVVVDADTTLTLTFSGIIDDLAPASVGAGDVEVNNLVGEVNNLVGLEGSVLEVKDARIGDKGSARVSVNLNNASQEVKDLTKDKEGFGFGGAVEGTGGHHANIGGKDGFDVQGLDTTFEGTIKADATVDFSKTGDGKLTIGSGATKKGGIVADGSGLKLRDGSVTLQGDAEGGNKLGSLTFAYDVAPHVVGKDSEGKDVVDIDDKTDNTGLTLTNGADLTLHDIVEAAVAADGTPERGGTVTLGNDSVLTLDNAGKRCGTVLKDTHIVSAKGEVGSVVVAPDSKLVLAEAATLEGVNLEVQGNALTSLEGDKHIVTAGQLKLSGGTLDIGTSKGNSVGVIYGDGTLTASNGTALTVTGKAAGEEVFTGTLAGEGTLDVNGGAVTLQNVTTLPGTWDLSVNHAGALTLNSLTPAATVDPLGLMKFDDINVNGGTLTLSGNAKSNVKGKVHLSGDNTLHVDIVEGETDVALDLDFFGADGKQLTQEELKKLQDKKQLTLELDGPGSTYFRPQLLGSNAGVWHLMLEIQPNDFFIGSHKNVRSGGNLIIDADNPYSAAYQYVTSPEGQSGDLAKVLSVLKQEIDAAGTSVPIHEEKMAAAVAGSAIATLGSASVQDVHRQMQSIGNRASMIGTGEMKVNADPVCKPMHTWVNAETGYHKVNADSWAPGYTLNGWGGTLGIARELTHRTSGGLALTAMYNDFKSDTADYAKGDLDTTYVSGFLTTHRGPWTHSFLATLGKEDVSLNRIVSYGTGSYRTNGDTDGFVAGAMYEVSYTKTFNRKHAMSLQPLFNVEFRHAKLGAYDERGSDAALHVDDVKADVVTFGLGSRFHAVLTQNAFGRPAMFEARALGKVDVGDNYGKSTNRLVHGNLTQEVEASEVGRVGGEIGAGITIPLRSRGGTIFVEASAEFRDRYTNFSTSAGYMYNY